MSNLTVDERSLLYLANSSLGHAGWATLGLFGVIANSVVLLVIYRTKDLHTRGGCNMIVLAVDDVLTCGLYAAWGLRNYIYYQLARPLVESVLHCWCHTVFEQLTLNQANSAIYLAIAMDRCVAMTFPIWYRNLGSCYAILLCGTPWVVTMLRTSVTFLFLTNNTLVPFCAVDKVVQRWFIIKYLAMPNTIVKSLTIILYLAALFGVLYKLLKHRRSQRDLSNYKRHVEFKVIRSLLIIVFFYASLMYTSSHVITNGRTNGANMAKLVPIVKNLWILNSTLNIFVYFCTIKAFRDTCLSRNLLTRVDTKQASRISRKLTRATTLSRKVLQRTKPIQSSRGI